FRSMQYLRDYFENVQAVEKNQDQKLIFLINSILYVAAYKTLHLIYLFFKPSKLDASILMHYDVFYFILPKSTVNLLGVLCAVQEAYTIHVLYFKCNHKVNRLIHDILICGNLKFFINKRRHKNVDSKI